MILGVVSDTHNHLSNVEKIIDIFNSSDTKLVIHTGDITQAKTLERFSRLNCPLMGVYGNNDLEEEGLKEISKKFNFILEIPPMIIKKGSRKLLIVHQPDDIEKILQKEKGIDLVLHGHTHRYREEILNGVKIFNPGECAGLMKGKNAVGVVDLNSLESKRIFF